MNLRLFHVAALLCYLLSISSIATLAQAPFVSKVWVADNGDDTYKNPIIHADYSDPDVIRVGDDFYMTASSFNCIPGLPILHSKDLVNWRIVNYAIRELEPKDVFSHPQHGDGVWAPSIRYHEGRFYIYYGDPDYGIYVTTSKKAEGSWSKPILVKKAKGWIDPSPLWDDDGNVYLVHAFAGSRAGIKSILIVNRMNHDGTQILDNGVTIFDGHVSDPTVEGPKFYKLNGWYYVLAPAGGVTAGWQIALRSKNIYGPYEKKVVLAQGTTAINGPHQGGLVDTQTGEWWFIHFQDKGAYGRVVHLEPVAWKDGFPVIGADPDGDGTGEPVLRYKKPNVGKTYRLATPPDSDEFNDPTLGLQWQWQANPDLGWASLEPKKGVLRLFSVPAPNDGKDLWTLPNLLLQKFPAEKFTVTAKVTLMTRYESEKFGFIVMGQDYSYLGITYVNGRSYVRQSTNIDAEKGIMETNSVALPIHASNFYLRVKVENGGICIFSFSQNGKTFNKVGKPFTARQGRWIGAKIGFFSTSSESHPDPGWADIDWIRFAK